MAWSLRVESANSTRSESQTLEKFLGNPLLNLAGGAFSTPRPPVDR